MNRTILLRHLSNSSLAGQSREFRQEKIRLGRKADNDVVFNPEQDRLVSGHHCEIVALADGLWVLDPGSTNGTFVNGRRISGRAQVTERDQIMLGETGPLLAVSFVDVAAGAPSTVMGTIPDIGLATSGLLDVDPEVATATAVAPPQAWSLEAPLPKTDYPQIQDAPFAATAIAPPFAPPVIDRSPSRTSLGQKTSIGFNTLMTELDKATKRERKRVFTIVTPIVLVLVLGSVGLAWYLNREANNRQSAVAAPAAPTQPSPATSPTILGWAEILDKPSHSVYVVVKRKQGQADAGVGTAWSAAKGTLATNAHVAQAFLDLGEGEYLVARSYADEPRDLKVTAVQQHPGYLEFNRLYKAHFPLNPATGEQVIYAIPYDVALMTIAESDIPQQSPPLELADMATMLKAAEASDIAYVGYPMEQSVGGGVNLQHPRPQQFLGAITRKTDAFIGNTSAEKSNIFQYQVPVQGGASGSPVFNHEGKVIGLVSGNDHAFIGGVRIAIGGKAYGPRADAVRELLEKNADAKMAPMIPDWRAFLRARYNDAKEAGLYQKRAQSMANNAVIVGRPRNAPDNVGRLDPNPVSRTQVMIGTSGDAGRRELTYTVQEAGYYTVVAITDNPDMTPLVTAPEIEGRLRSRTPNPVTREQLDKLKETILGQGQPTTATVASRLAPGEMLKYTVAGVSKDPAATATMQVLIFRATP